jgi:hypothetical protein
MPLTNFTGGIYAAIGGWTGDPGYEGATDEAVSLSVRLAGLGDGVSEV